MSDRSKSRKEKLLEFIEKDRFSFSAAIIYIFILGAVRSLLEAAVGSYHLYSRYLFFQHVLLSYPELLMGVLIIYFIAKTDVRKIWNVFLLGFWILLLPPIVDYVIFGDLGMELGQSYDYLKVEEIAPALYKMWNPLYTATIASKGQGVMFLLLMFGSAGYVAMKTDLIQKLVSAIKSQGEAIEFIKALAKTIVSYLAIAYLFLFIGAFTFIIHLESENLVFFNYFKIKFPPKYYLFFQNYGYEMERIVSTPGSGRLGLAQSLILQQRHLLLSSFFILLTIIFGLIVLYILSKEKLFIMLKDIPWHKISFYASSGLLGILSVHLLDPDFTQGWAIDPTYPLHLPYVFICLVIIFILSLFSKFIADIGAYKREESRDTPLERGDISKYHYVHISAVLAMSGLFFSVILGRFVTIIAIIWVLLTLISYGIGRKGVLKKFNNGVFGSFAVLMGIYTPGLWITKYIDYTQSPVEVSKEYIQRTPQLTPKIFLIVLWVFLSFWFLSLAKSPYQEEKDKKLFFEDLFSFLRSKRDIMVMGGSVLLLLFPLIYFQAWYRILFFLSIAIFAPIWYRLVKNITILYGLFIIEMILFGFSFLY